MGECGARYTLDSLPSIVSYIERMLRDGRIACIENSNKVEGYLIYSICNNIDPYYKKKTWVYVPQEPNGKTLYVEKLVCKQWTKELRSKFEEIITEQHPNLYQAVWHRYGKVGDRIVKCRRRLCTK